MDYVFIVKHDVYGYEDNHYESFVEVFCNENSARNYFEVKKEQVMEEYYDYTDTNSIQELEDNFEFYSDLEPTVYGLPYLYMDLDEYGSDRLVVQRKDIMSF
jgi:CRISPR/Cas system-associated protein Cas10 (large subunit of type III CRISPR-Cas system)